MKRTQFFKRLAGVIAALAVCALIGWQQPTIAQTTESEADNSITDDETWPDDITAEEPGEEHTGCHRHGPPPPLPEEVMTSQLSDLTEEQRNELSEIFAEEHAQMRAVHEKTCKRVEGVLTESQREELCQMKPPPPPFGPPPGDGESEEETDEGLLEELLLGS